MRTLELNEASAFLRMHPIEVRMREARPHPRGGAGARLGLINRAFLSSVGRTVEEQHDIRSDELWIVSRTEGKTEARGPTARGTLAGDPVGWSP